MAKLTAAHRRALPSSEFAEPGKRKYPVFDRSHAANALARVSQHGTPAEKAEVRAKVHAKYPTMGHRGHVAKAHEHLRTAHRQHSTSGMREHLTIAMEHLHAAKQGQGESHAYDFRRKRNT